MPYLVFTLLFPQLVNSHQHLKLNVINEKGRRIYAKQVLGKTDYKRLARATDEWIILEQFILEKIERALPLHSDLEIHSIANTVISEANKFGFDPLFILAMIEQESHIQPDMLGSAGEIGLMQVLPDTAKWIAKKNKMKFVTKKQLMDPVFNIKIGIRYLAWLNNKFPHASHSVAAYNMGAKNVYKLLKKNKQPEVYFGNVVKRYKRLYTETLVHRAGKGQQTIVAVQ
jgi:soluble lytic murein transglycosylase